MTRWERTDVTMTLHCAAGRRLGRRRLLALGCAAGTVLALTVPARSAAAAVPLALEAGPDTTIAEGSALTRTIAITDQVDDDAPGWTYQVSYGDGTLGAEQVTLIPSITLDHVYTNGPASHTVMISVFDGAETVVDSFVVTVTNVAPIASLQIPGQVLEGTTYPGQIVVTDPGAESLVYFIDWNDGLQAQWFVPLGDGKVSVLYRDDTAGSAVDNRLVKLSVLDDAASSLTSYPLTVVNVPPVIAASGAATVTAGQTYTLTLGAITDPGHDVVTSQVITWGDGSTQTVPVGAGTYTHTFTTAGASTITVGLTDDDGTFTGASVPVTVAAATPSAPSGLTATATSKSSIHLTWTNTTTNQTSIQVERCKGTGCTSFSRVATLSGTAVAYTNTGLASKNVYSYRIRSVNAAGSSPYSAVVSARTL